MATIKTVKGIDDRTWKEFRSLASREGLTASQFFKQLVTHYKHDSKAFWDDVFSTGRILSDKEATEISKVTRAFRKEKGWRT